MAPFAFFLLLPASDAGRKHLWAADSGWGRSRSSRGAADGADGQTLWKHGDRRTTSKHRNSPEAPRRSERRCECLVFLCISRLLLPDTQKYLSLTGCWISHLVTDNIPAADGSVVINIKSGWFIPQQVQFPWASTRGWRSWRIVSWSWRDFHQSTFSPRSVLGPSRK